VHHVASSSSSTEEPQTQKADTLCTVLGAALALVLARRGWTIDATPGNHVTATHDGIVIQPFDAVRRMSARELGWEEWQRTCDAAGIADIDLTEAAKAGPVAEDDERPVNQTSP
jgi:hypothetical protein